MADSELGNDDVHPDDKEHSHHFEGETHGSSSRYWLSNDITALGLAAAMCGLMAADAVGYYGYDAPTIVVQAFVTAFMIAVVWLFGRGAAKMVNLGGSK